MKEWTIMVYMAGDNNLSEDMITALKGMTEIGSEANINVVALYDGCYPAAPIKFYDFTKTRAGTAGATTRRILEDFNESIEEVLEATATGTGDAVGETLPALPPRRGSDEIFKIRDFLPRVMRRYRAKKYALILSGHSDGVIGRRLLPDGDSDVKLNIKSLRNILHGNLPVDENGKQKKFDLIGFDGCLMGMLEIGYELKDVAEVMVASQGNIPTSGWVYQNMLAELKEKKGALDAREFAVSLVQSYVDYNEDFAISGRSINISACDLQALNNNNSVYGYVQELAKLFLDILDLPVYADDKKDAATAEKIGEFEENQLIKEKFIDWMILSHYRSQTFMHSQAVDVVDFTYNILLLYRKWQAENEIMGLSQIDNPTVNKIRRKIEEIFNTFINVNKAMRDENEKYILQSCAIGAEYQFSQGVSLFLPWTRMAFNMIKRRYAELQFNNTEHWLDFIDRLTALTMREYQEEPFFNQDFDSLQKVPFDDLRHREVGGREVGGREVGGREVGGREVGGREVGGREVGGRGGVEDFYLYFSQFRNYRSDVFKTRYVDKSSFM